MPTYIVAAPPALNGESLRDELAAATSRPAEEFSFLLRGSELVVSSSTAVEETTVNAVVAAHTGSIPQRVNNREAIRADLATAMTYFSGNYTNWPSMNAGQKDVAARNAQRALGRIARWLLDDFGQAG